MDIEFEELTATVAHRVQILMQNIEQVGAIIAATFGSHLLEVTLQGHCLNPSSDVEKLSCQYTTMIPDAWQAAKNGDVQLTIETLTKVWHP